MDYNFDEIINRCGTSCEKYDSRASIFGNESVTPLWVADMDFATPDFVVDAMKRRMEHPVFGYTFRDSNYYNSIVGWVDRRAGWKLDASWLDFAPGVVAGLVYAIKAFSCKGDGVVIQTPVYGPFNRVTSYNDRKVLCNPLLERDGVFTIDFDDLDAKLSEAKIMLLCNPHNPTGRVFTLEELERIGELCIKHDVIIVSDEIHSDIIQSPHKHIHIASISDEIAERTITFIAASKTFNLAGFSTAVSIISNAELRERYCREYNKMHADQGNIFGKVALEAAYNNGDSWVDQMNKYVGANMDFVIDLLARELPQVSCRKSEGTYMLWIDFRSFLEKMSNEQLEDILINKVGIGMNNGLKFGPEGLGWYRMNVACPRAILETLNFNPLNKL